VRASNTEPLLRLNLEANSDDAVASKVAEIEPLLGTRVEH
jgi:phosphomannomutase